MKFQNFLMLCAALSFAAITQAAVTQAQLEGKAKGIIALGKFLSKPASFRKAEGSTPKTVVQQKRKSSSNCHECDGATLIFASDFDPLFGYQINVPGTYCLEEDVVFNPTFNDTPAIVINASNVVLHLRKKTLSAAGSATGIIGILVNAVSNVSIDHGTISDFNLYGIRINPGSSFINLDHLNVTRCGAVNTFGGGIAMSSAFGSTTQNISLNYVNASENIFIGLTVASIDQLNVTNSKFNKNIGTNAPVFGETTWGAFLLPAALALPNPPSFGCSNINFVNVEANGNTSLGGAIGIEAISVPAFGLPFNTNLNFFHCETNDNRGGGITTPGQVNEGEGLVLAGVQNAVIEDSRAEGNRTLAAAPSGIPGFHASVGFGIPFFGENIRIINCVAKYNSGNGDISAGFRAEGSDSITISHCCAIANNNGGVGGEAWGFTTDPNVGNSTSFGPSVSTNFLFDYNRAEKNISTNGLGGGFKFVSQSGSVLSNNSSSCNAIGILIADGCSEGCSSSNNVVSYNKVEKNSQSGIVDQIPGANTLYFANVSRANGPAGDSNFVGDIFPTPVTCPKAKKCVPAGKTPIRLVVDGDACKVNTNCERCNKVENLDVRP